MANRPGRDVLLAAGVRVPEHVVHRDFRTETVILNLESGVYYGLNVTAARMLAALESSPSVGVAVERLTDELGQPAEVIERDVLTLCHALEDRGLIEVDV